MNKKMAVVSIVFTFFAFLFIGCGPENGGNGGGAPSLPTLLSPLKAILATLRPTFQWASNLATSYDFYLSKDPNPSFLSTLGTAQYTPPANLEAGKLYYWKVVGKNATGDSPASAIYYFVTPEQIPGEASIQIRDAAYVSNSQVYVTVKGYNLQNVSGIEIILNFNTSEMELSNLGGDYSGTFQAMGPLSGALMIATVGTGTVRVSLSLIGDPVDIPNNEILRVYFNTKNGSYPTKISIDETSSVVVNESGTLNAIDFDKSDQGIFLVGS
jgi:hypothetical protein